MMLLYNAAQVVTPTIGGFRVVQNGAVAAEEGRILYVGPSDQGLETYARAEQRIDVAGKVVLPGFVDSHTHAVFGGDRSGEFLMRLQGASYQEIAKAGGGILSTVRATRAASEDELFEKAAGNLAQMLRHGTTSLEIKSGYGLNREGEEKILRTANRLKETGVQDIAVTFLGAHDFPPEIPREEYFHQLLAEMLPRVARGKLAEFCDVFCDEGYYTLDQARAICEKARDLGLGVKMHVDELADVNGAALAGELGAVSADHLIHANDEGIRRMAKAGVVAVLLPGTSFGLKVARHAPARELIRAGVRVAAATDFNPGTCYCHSMLFVLQLSPFLYGLTAEEAITAVTLHAAAAMQRDSLVGSLEPGKQMDCLVFDIPHYGHLLYNLGINHLETVIKKGIVAWSKKQEITNRTRIHSQTGR
jgi:imidazolonepropionase